MSALATGTLTADSASQSKNNNSFTNRSSITEPKKRGCTLPLRSAIIVMVLINKSVLFLRDQADLVKENLYVSAHRARLKSGIPNVAFFAQTYSYYNNDTMEQLGIGPVLSNYTTFSNVTYNPSAPLQYFVLYYAKNKTCNNVCPVQSTAGKLRKYLYNDTTQSVTTLLDITATEYKAWTRTWWIKNQPAGDVYFTPAYVTVFLSIVQTISYPIYNSTNQFVAGGGFSFSVYSLSSVLDSLQGVSTNNTLSY
ncbi:hypothetical protein M427DRAFT_28720 [Gonapodya prolifera JEL478]|uniref:Uncharacterized protein n=1 Tax=Gonapodya prolifera (strain JEL478) TaxID=1344416 RepID=A0A139ATD0_GONPJ|nr:hypothetical protein M427DRAFT_28720 [Gonapodya prolifera JEL478]|eukprot:KXS19823.1 hypothetical protein M427DRAFT_28720 [Gonapodya prolifera JEL478]